MHYLQVKICFNLFTSKILDTSQKCLYIVTLIRLTSLYFLLIISDQINSIQPQNNEKGTIYKYKFKLQTDPWLNTLRELAPRHSSSNSRSQQTKSRLTFKKAFASFLFNGKEVNKPYKNQVILRYFQAVIGWKQEEQFSIKQELPTLQTSYICL